MNIYYLLAVVTIVGAATNIVKKESLKDVMFAIDKVAEESGVACPADVLFVIDATGSMREVFNSCLEFVTKVLEGLTISDTQDRVGVVLYSSPERKRLRIPLGSINDPLRLVKSIRALPFLSGITATGAALQLAELALKARRPDVRTSVVVITDGFSYDDVGGYASQLRGLPNTHVYAVSLGETRLKKGLELISGSADTVLYGPLSYGRLVKLIKFCGEGSKVTRPVDTATVHYVEMATDNTGRYLVPNPQLIPVEEEYNSGGEASGIEGCAEVPTTNQLYSEDEPAMSGSGEGNVEGSTEFSGNMDAEGSSVLTDETSSGDAYSGYAEPIDMSDTIDDIESKRNIETFATYSGCLYDVAFVFDASGSIEGRFEDQLAVANRLIERIALGPENTQIAAIKYAGKGKSRVIFDFQDFTDKKTMEKRISAVEFMSGTTHTNEALMRTAEIFLGPSARPNKAKPVAIVFTDGFSGEDPGEGAHFLHKMGVMVFVIGIDKNGEPINRVELETIAGHPSRVYTLSNIAKFEEEISLSTQNCLRKKNTRLN